jgi:hypothetical protein
MEENTEEKKKNYTAIKKGAIIAFVLAFILFNASKLFNYLGTKHTVDTGPDTEDQNIPKTKYDSLAKDAQKKLDIAMLRNDSLQKIIMLKDTDLKKVSDSLAIFVKKKPLVANNSAQKKTNSTADKQVK